MCLHAKSLQSCPTLGDTVDCSLPGSSVRGVLQARILEYFAMPSGGLPSPGVESMSVVSPALAGGFLTSSTPWEALYVYIYKWLNASGVLDHYSYLLCHWFHSFLHQDNFSASECLPSLKYFGFSDFFFSFLFCWFFPGIQLLMLWFNYFM